MAQPAALLCQSDVIHCTKVVQAYARSLLGTSVRKQLGEFASGFPLVGVHSNLCCS